MSLPVLPRIKIGRIARFWASKFSGVGVTPRAYLPNTPVDPQHQDYRPRIGRNHMTYSGCFRGQPLELCAQLEPRENGGSPGSPGPPRGQVGAEMESLGPKWKARGQRPYSGVVGASFGFADVNF